VFSNGVEHYILNGKSQDFFPQIGHKTIRFCKNAFNKFYFVSSQEYDRDCDIQCSDDIRFNASIFRSFEPGQMKVFDMHLTGTEEDGGEMMILMNQGDYLYLDMINLELCIDD